MVVPQAHDEDHGGGDGIAHLGHAAEVSKDIIVAKGLLLGGAEVGGERVARVVGDGGLGVADDLAVLDVEALDLGELAVGALDELGDDGDLLGGVDVEAGSGAVEGLDALSVGVEVAAIGVAVTGVAVGREGSAAVVALAHVLRLVGAGVGREGGGDVVGLPDVHLGAAAAHGANSGVGIVARGDPAVRVGDAVDELDVTGALGVAVAGSVLGAGLVAVVARLAAVLVHGDEVEGAVETAADLGHVHVKGELVAQEGEHLVRVLVLHEVETAANVLAVGALSDKLQAQLVAARGDAVGARVVGAVDAALLSASLAIRADGGIPLVARVAVGAALHRVRPSPVGVDDNGARDGAAAARGALGPVQSRVSLLSRGADLLSSCCGD